MGFFSWKTQDTEKSISNAFSCRGTFSVTMTDDKGRKWTEHNYEGYGVFGGKDFYELLAEMNGKKTRDEGINLFFYSNPDIKFKSPNLNENPSLEWREETPLECENQGYFYDDYDDYDEEDFEEEEYIDDEVEYSTFT